MLPPSFVKMIFRSFCCLLLINLHFIRSFHATTPPYLVNVISSALGPTVQGFGVIIDHDKVLTAAVLVVKYNETVVSQTVTRYCPQDAIGPFFTPTEIYVHRDYFFELDGYIYLDEYYFRNNLAVLVFPEHTFTGDQIAKLPEKPCCEIVENETAQTVECSVAGLRQKKVKLRSLDDGARQYGILDSVPSNIFTTPADGSFACTGLPGSPLIYHDEVIGIFSYCREDCNTELFTTFTSIQPYLVPIQQAALDEHFFTLKSINEYLFTVPIADSFQINGRLNYYGANQRCSKEMLKYLNTFEFNKL